MKKYLLILFYIFTISTVEAQFNPTDFISWNWIRFEGTIDRPEDLEPKNDKLAYSMEIHYRLKNNASDFNQLLLRPMLGYKVDEDTTLWLGTTLVEFEKNGEILSEYRVFQMISYGHKLNKLPIVLLGNTRVEERFLEGEDEMNLRIRQLLRASIEIFKFENSSLSLIFQNEYFLRLTDTEWAGAKGFDQNRFMLGLDYKTKLGNVPATFTIGYLNNVTPRGTTHGVGVGVRLIIPNKKKPSKKPHFE
jgi:hypothetical protein